MLPVTEVPAHELETVIPLIEQSEKKFVQKSLTLAAAKKRLEELREKFPRCPILTTLNVFQVEICREFTALKKNPAVAHLQARLSSDPKIFKISDLIDDTLVLALKMFRDWRQNEQKMAKGWLFQLRNNFSLICQCCPPSETQSLHDSIGILHHLSQNEPFLALARTPLNPELTPNEEGLLEGYENHFEEMFRPEVWALYQESLSFAHFGFAKFQSYLKGVFHPEFERGLKKLKADPQKHPLVENYYQNLKKYFDFSEIAGRLEKARVDPDNQKLEQLLQKLIFLEPNYVEYTRMLLPIYFQLSIHWGPWNPPEKLQTVVLGQQRELEAKKDPLLSKLADTHREAVFMMNSCCTEPLRIPALLMQTMQLDATVRQVVLESTRQFVTKIGTHFDFYGIDVTDLLMNDSFQIFAQFDPQSEQRRSAEREFEELMSHLSGIVLSDYPLSFCKRFLNQFTPYREAMEALFPQATGLGNFPQLLKGLGKLLPLADSSFSLFRVKFGCFFSVLYSHTGKGELDISLQEIPFLQGQLLSAISLIEKIVEEKQEPLETLLTNLVSHPIGQSKPFWKLQLKVVQIILKEYGKAYQTCREIKKEIPSWSTKEDFIRELKTCLPKLAQETMGSFLKTMNIQFNLLARIPAEQPEIQKVISLINEMIAINNTFVMVMRPLQAALNFADDFAEKKKAPEKREKPVVKKREEVEEKEPEAIVGATPTIPYKPTAFERSLEPLVALQRRDPLPLDLLEDPFSLFKRKEKMEQALQTQLYLMHLLEEEKDPELKPLCRGDTELFRLHEMTQKLALAFFPIRETGRPHLLLDPNQRHLFTSLHDGVYLAKVLSPSEPLFGNKKSEPFVKDQEKVLKVSYWFSEERPEPNSAYEMILPRCKEIWRKMEQQRALELTCLDLVDSLWKMRAFVQQKRERPVVEFPELPPLRELLGKVVAPIVELATALDTHAKACMRAPILFTNRHLEIQIGLLTNVMKEFLYKRGHSPDQELEGRPLKYSHNVLHLWGLLKSYCKDNIEEQLAHFVGDPRYPFPNKTAVSHDLVTSYELSRLLAIAQTGFLDEEKVQLFKKYVADFSVNDLKGAGELVKKRLQEHLERVEKKTRLAFVLAAKLSE